jgi:hypothetical protein
MYEHTSELEKEQDMHEPPLGHLAQSLAHTNDKVLVTQRLLPLKHVHNETPLQSVCILGLSSHPLLFQERCVLCPEEISRHMSLRKTNGITPKDDTASFTH